MFSQRNAARCFTGLTALILLACPMLAQDPLTALRNSRRVLLVFAPNSADPAFVQQQHLLQNHASDLEDRDLIVIPVLTQWTSADAPLRHLNPAFTADTEQKRLRSRYILQPGEFAVLLLGKDGGEKLRSHTPVTMEVLRTLIDSMPMRQQEMQERKGSMSSHSTLRP